MIAWLAILGSFEASGFTKMYNFTFGLRPSTILQAYFLGSSLLVRISHFL